MTTTNTQTLADFIREMTGPQPMPLDPAVIKRVNGAVPMPDKPGRVIEIDKETYWWFLEVLPPLSLDRGVFCFAEGMERHIFFFKRANRFFVRCLTWCETRLFCKRAGLPLPGFWQKYLSTRI